ncbi:hypothetical protein, partial [Escherichia sp. MOD1-EC7003]
RSQNSMPVFFYPPITGDSSGLKRGYRLAELVMMHEPLARMRWCG